MPLGGGDMALVERARLVQPYAGLEAGETIVIKRLQPGPPPALRAAFEAEGRLGMQVRHAHLVRTLAVLPDFEGSPAIVQRYVPGMTLADLLREGPLPEPLARRLAADIAGALAALHAAGFAHNDVKPSNIVLATDGGDAVLLDLGLATPLQSATDARSEHDPGSLEWMAPERQTGGPPTMASDVFSLGLVLFHAATGAAIAQARRRPSQIAPRLSPFFDEYIGALLAPDPAQRLSASDAALLAQQSEASEWWRGRAKSAGPISTAYIQDSVWPNLGRDAELAQLARIATSSLKKESPPAILSLIGPEGSGKWQLIAHFAALTRRRENPPLYLAIRTTPMREARPHGSMLELLRLWLGLPHGFKPTADHIHSLRRLLPPKGADTLLFVLGVSDEAVIPGSVTQALTDWLVALAEEQPLLLFLDELHDSGPDTMRVVAQLAARANTSMAMMMVLGERDDLPLPPSPDRRRLCDRVLRLGPISAAAVTRFVNARFEKETPRVRLARVLMERSRGNPGLLRELMNTLESTGATIPGRGGLWRLLVAPEDLPLPSSLRGSIQNRYLSMNRRARTLLARLAVLGGRLTPEVIRRAYPNLRDVDLTTRLTNLERRGWLVAHGDHFRFARPAQPEVIRATLSRDTLAHLHIKAAEGLAPRPGEPASITLAIRRAWHLREAGQARSLIEALLPVVRALVTRGQPQRVATLADWGIAALEQLDKEAASKPGDEDLMLYFLELAADAAGRVGKRTRERELLDRLADFNLSTQSEASQTAAASRLARTYFLHGRYARATASFGLARSMLKNAINLASDAGRLSLQAEAMVQLARVQAEVGELDHAESLCNQALELIGDNELGQAAAFVALAQVEILRSRPDLALKHIDRALEIGRHMAATFPSALKAESYLARARIWRDLGRPNRALGSVKKALELAVHAQERVIEAEAAARLGGLLVVAGDEEAAEAQLREALLIAGEIEDRRSVSLASLWLGTLIAEREGLAGGNELQRSIDAAGDIGLHRNQAMGLAIHARVELLRSHSGENGAALQRAEEQSLRAAGLIERHGAEQRDTIVIIGTRAMLLYETERKDEARALVAELRRAMRRTNSAIQDPILRRLNRKATTRLLEAVLSPEGPIFPRS